MTRVLIAGAGIGGLALAQALHHQGFDVAVFERDPTARTRRQGYRIHIDADGNAALRACLPPPVLDRARATSGVNGDLVAVLTPGLERVHAQTFPGVPDDEITHVDRETLRRALLTGLEGVVRFGRAVTGYRVADSGRVRVLTEAGEEEGDLLVGADGVGSAVRRRLLPHAEVRDIGLRCLYGRTLIEPGTVVPEDFDRGFCWVSDGSGYGAGFATVRFRTRPAGADDLRDYVMITLVGTPERLGPSTDLQQIVVDATAGWHPAVRELVAHGRDFFPITLRAGERVDPWPSGPVTLLGDAIHTMPPTGGVGANTALQDAATLAAELAAGPLPEAVARYERIMLPRGFATVERSLATARQMLP